MSWKGFGALAGSWIGGTGNMAAASEMLATPPEQFGLAVLADNVVYVVWLPILLASRNFAEAFNKWARVPEERIRAMDAAAALVATDEPAPEMREYIYLYRIDVDKSKRACGSSHYGQRHSRYANGHCRRCCRRSRVLCNRASLAGGGCVERFWCARGQLDRGYR